jgi:predicted peroxiredoxin
MRTHGAEEEAMRAELGVAIACMAVVLAGPGVTSGEAAEQPRDGVLVHVSHGGDDAQRLLMALSMASMMSKEHDVLVYFDIKGVEAVLKDAADVSYAQFTPLKPQLSELQRKGVALIACPGCLKAAGKTAEDLAPGVRVAEKSQLFSFTKGRILTLDY